MKRRPHTQLERRFGPLGEEMTERGAVPMGAPYLGLLVLPHCHRCCINWSQAIAIQGETGEWVVTGAALFPELGECREYICGKVFVFRSAPYDAIGSVMKYELWLGRRHAI